MRLQYEKDGNVSALMFTFYVAEEDKKTINEQNKFIEQHILEITKVSEPVYASHSRSFSMNITLPLLEWLREKQLFKN